MANVFTQLGLNAEFAADWGEGRRAMIEASYLSSYEDRKAKVDIYFEKLNKFFRSQPGFESFPESENLRKIQENQEFFKRVDEIMSNIRSIPENPKILEFDEETAADYARAVFLIAKVKTCWKLTSCWNKICLRMKTKQKCLFN